MKEIDLFFEIGWIHNRPRVFIVPNRKTIDNLRNQKTANWVVGWSTGDNVYLLDKNNFESESGHTYSDQKYYQLLKHELCHSFFRIISKGKNKPLWLNDGTAIFVSKQYKNRHRPEKLNKFLESTETIKEGLYEESGFAVEFLVKNYGKEKLINLIKKLPEINNDKEFENEFKKTYGFELKYEQFNKQTPQHES